jgi:hypothetical protein
MKKFVLLVALATLIVQTSSAIDVPAPPLGFTWQEVPELKAAFLKPNGWFFKREEGKGTLAFLITKENIEHGGEFQTGLTINVFRLKKDPAVERGKKLIGDMATAHHAESEKWARKVGPFQEFGCLVKITDATGSIEMQALTLANPKTNTLYLFMFESPDSDWNAAWTTGKQIMDTLVVDDEV